MNFNQLVKAALLQNNPQQQQQAQNILMKARGDNPQEFIKQAVEAVINKQNEPQIRLGSITMIRSAINP
jgi:hypothetical protein